MSTQQLAMDLEEHCISPSEWSKAPKYVREEAELAEAERIPTAIGHRDDIGWFILHSGQGPYIAYQDPLCHECANPFTPRKKGDKFCGNDCIKMSVGLL